MGCCGATWMWWCVCVWWVGSSLLLGARPHGLASPPLPPFPGMPSASVMPQRQQLLPPLLPPPTPPAPAIRGGYVRRRRRPRQPLPCRCWALRGSESGSLESPPRAPITPIWVCQAAGPPPASLGIASLLPWLLLQATPEAPSRGCLQAAVTHIVRSTGRCDLGTPPVPHRPSGDW